jgi:hypothetical protein
VSVRERPEVQEVLRLWRRLNVPGRYEVVRFNHGSAIEAVAVCG